MSNESASVVIPVHNAAPYIAECLNSLLRQTYSELDIIVVDDGSSDGSAEIVKSYQTGNNVRLIQQRASGGPSSPRNRGLRESTADVVFLFDADDIAHPEKVARTMDELAKAPQEVCIAISDFAVINEVRDGGDEASFLRRFSSLQSVIRASNKAGAVILDAPTAYDRLLVGNFIGTSSVAIRREALTSVGYFDEKLKYSEDYDFWIRLVRAGGLVVIKDVLHYYRHHEAGLSKSPARVLNPYKIKVLQKQFANRLTASQNQRLNEQIAENYFDMGWESKQSGDFDAAWNHYNLALRHSANLRTLKGMAGVILRKYLGW